MTTFLCCLLWIAAALVLPLMILDWATCSTDERCRRLRALGWSQQRIADHLRVTRYRVRRAIA